MADKKDPIDYTYRGQPPVYDTPEQLWDKAVEYFKSVTTTSGIIRATITGVTRHLGFADRQSLTDQAKRSPEFSLTISRNRQTDSVSSPCAMQNDAGVNRPT